MESTVVGLPRARGTLWSSGPGHMGGIILFRAAFAFLFFGSGCDQK